MAVQTLVNRNFTLNHDHDFTCKGQVERLKNKTLVTDNAELVQGGSFKGRGYVLLNSLAHIPRAILGTLKNILFVAARAFDFLRAILEFDKADIKATGKALFSGIGALALRQINFVTDSVKLFGGVFHPKLAISYDGDAGDAVDGADFVSSRVVPLSSEAADRRSVQ